MPQAKRKTTARTKKPRKRVHFFHKPTCMTCRKARAYMERNGFHLSVHDLTKDRLSAADLEKLIGRRNHAEFLNPRNELYRRKKMRIKPPSKKEAIRLMAKEPNLIRRPVVVCGGRVVVGFDKNGIARL